jgi:hypothetical protein
MEVNTFKIYMLEKKRVKKQLDNIAISINNGLKIQATGGSSCIMTSEFCYIVPDVVSEFYL